MQAITIKANHNVLSFNYNLIVTNVTVVSSHDDTAKPSIGQDLVQKGLGGDSSTPPKPSDAFDRLTIALEADFKDGMALGEADVFIGRVATMLSPNLSDNSIFFE
ncbi:hypothetical protein SeMB42_g00396 [Synchytrium endobioticum]|uniref:Uncharacterized protein n=1 Tax=Synchytrium endobioticum TaxID=286115 RepID=A0A507DSH9_9FUNG|nr:hypothetical protein SeMB42_g00396 [Synchytrium endobioticum]